MRLTPDEKKALRTRIHDAIGSGLEYGVPPESPPQPPTNQQVNQAAYWAMGEVTRLLARKRWTAQQDRERLEEQVRLLEEKVRRLEGRPDEEDPMATYTPRAGDLARDDSDELWFVYADCDNPNQLYAIGATYSPTSTGHPIGDVRKHWGPLALEHRPEATR